MLSGNTSPLVIAVVALLLVSKSVDGFVAPTKPQSVLPVCMATNRVDGEEQKSNPVDLAKVGVASFVTAATFFLSPFNPAAMAEDAVVETPPPAPQYSITKCSLASNSPVCISTSNIRQLDLYAPPWTFSSSADEAMARLKGAVESEPLNSIVPSDDNTSRRLLVDSKRSKLGTTAYRMEFIINEADGVITFRSSAPDDINGPDFGLQRQRLSEIRGRATFGVMGEALNSADTKSTGEKGYGFVGQLKSFYGLQSGGGFEEVLSQ